MTTPFNIMIYLFILFCITQALDVYTTITAIDSGKAHEANPIMATLFAKFGMQTTLIVIKLAICVFVGYMFLVYDANAPWWIMALFDIGYIVVLENNFKVIKGTS